MLEVYGCGTWSPKKVVENSFEVMERERGEVIWSDFINNQTLRQMSDVKDIIATTAERKIFLSSTHHWAEQAKEVVSLANNCQK